MKIVFASAFGNWWGEYPPDVLDHDCGRTVGGGEAGMLTTAFGLAALGHGVTVYSCAQPGEYRGVRFLPDRRFYADVPGAEGIDAVVAWSDPKPLAAIDPRVARLIVQQLNDLNFPGGWRGAVDCLISPSAHHGEFMRRLGWAGRLAVVHNGCDPWLWEDAPPPADRSMQVGYWSSPDRGLHHVLRVWPRVRREVPDARLVVGYEINRLITAYIGARPDWSQSFARIVIVRDAVLAARHDPSIEFIGAVSRTKLREVQKATRVMAYPSDGICYTEGFGIAVLEACAAGCLPIIRPADALPSIYRSAARYVTAPTGSEEFDDSLVWQIVTGLKQWAADPVLPSLALLRQKANEYTWDRSVREMDAAIHETIEAKR